MKLYHYTTAENALCVALSGLRPGNHKQATADSRKWQTMGLPVVWLTREESNLATPEHVAHFQRLGVNTELNVGDLLYGGSVRCVVHLERHNRKLIRWADFLRTTNIVEANRSAPDDREQWITGRDILRRCEQRMMPNALAQWWIYLGEVPPHKILVPLTVAMAIQGCDFLINAGCPTTDECEDFRKMRQQLAALEPNSLLVLEHKHDGQIRLKQHIQLRDQTPWETT